MANDADNNGGGANEAEKQLAVLVVAVAQQAQQLLALVGFHVEPKDLEEFVKQELAAQGQLSTSIYATFSGAQLNQFPMFAVSITKGEAQQIITQQGPRFPPFAVAGPKRLTQQSGPAEIAAGMTALQFALNPALRVTVRMLGGKLAFSQVPAPNQPKPKKIIV